MTDNAKTVEQLESERIEARKARFAQDPDSFIELSEVVMCAIRMPNAGLGVGTYVNGTRQEMDIAIVELQHTVFQNISGLKMKEAQEKQGRIIKPQGKIKDIFRRH